jgi:hypothetical protein
MVRVEEHVRIGLHTQVTFVKAAFHDQCLTILPQSREEFLSNAQRRGSIRRPFFDAWESAGDP